jgi:hypothetical protein
MYFYIFVCLSVYVHSVQLQCQPEAKKLLKICTWLYLYVYMCVSVCNICIMCILDLNWYALYVFVNTMYVCIVCICLYFNATLIYICICLI